eukprot:6471656-Amphidinium_carterae.1
MHSKQAATLRTYCIIVRLSYYALLCCSTPALVYQQTVLTAEYGFLFAIDAVWILANLPNIQNKFLKFSAASLFDSTVL